MADNAFTQAFNFGNLAFKASKGETFQIDNGVVVTAIEIAEMSQQELLAAGGKFADNTVVLYVLKSELHGISDGTKIIVRGKRLRVGPIEDCGDNKVMLTAGPAGIKLR